MPSPPKAEDVDYIQFLIAAQSAFTCTEAARCHGAQEHKPAHDAFTRLLTRRPPDGAALWAEVGPLVERGAGLLVVDDTTIDKPHARAIELVTRHWSGTHKRVVSGINLVTLLWTDGGAMLPVDCRLYDKRDGLTKNDHFRAMLQTAHARGFAPECVCFDSWYASLDNLKLVRSLGWRWLARLERDRQVDPDGSGNRRVEDVAIPEGGARVHLRGYGFVRVFRVIHDWDDVEHWAASDEGLPEAERERLAGQAWAVEVYHRGLKQCCGVARCQARSARAQRNHILLCLRAFVRLEANRLRTGLSWYEAKKRIVRDAMRSYLAQPTLLLEATA